MTRGSPVHSRFTDHGLHTLRGTDMPMSDVCVASFPTFEACARLRVSPRTLAQAAALSFQLQFREVDAWI